MQNEGTHCNGKVAKDDDLEAQEGIVHTSLDVANDAGENQTVITIVVSNEESQNEVRVVTSEQTAKSCEAADDNKEKLPGVVSPKKEYLSRTSSFDEECRVCQQEMEEDLIDLGCQCRGGLARAHRSCIDAWFRTKGSNRCEICQQIAVNVPPPESQPSQTNYWVWRVDPAYRGPGFAQERERGCFSPLWVAFSILIGGLLLDVLISITLGVSALPVNIIIGVIVVLGLGTALRLALEFCHEWNLRRVAQRTQRIETNVNLGYHPAL